jgi:hypothetical protein
MLVTLILPALALVSTTFAMPAPQAEARSVVDNLPRGFKDQNLCVRDPAKFNYNDRLLKGQGFSDGAMTYEKCVDSSSVMALSPTDVFLLAARPSRCANFVSRLRRPSAPLANRLLTRPGGLLSATTMAGKWRASSSAFLSALCEWR